MRRRHEPAASDARILGSGAFVESLLAEAEQKTHDALRFKAAIPDLAALARLIAQKEAVSLSDLLSGARKTHSSAGSTLLLPDRGQKAPLYRRLCGPLSRK